LKEQSSEEGSTLLQATAGDRKRTVGGRQWLATRTTDERDYNF